MLAADEGHTFPLRAGVQYGRIYIRHTHDVGWKYVRRPRDKTILEIFKTKPIDCRPALNWAELAGWYWREKDMK